MGAETLPSHSHGCHRDAVGRNPRPLEEGCGLGLSRPLTRGGGAEPLIPAGEPAWAAFSSGFPRPLPPRLVCVPRVFAWSRCRARGRPRPIPCRPCHKPSRQLRSCSPRSFPTGAGPGRFPRQGWRLPQLQLPVPRPAPWGCRGSRRPSATLQPQSRAALPQDGLPGRARLDGRGKACETHLVSPSRSCATRRQCPAMKQPHLPAREL